MSTATASSLRIAARTRQPRLPTPVAALSRAPRGLVRLSLALLFLLGLTVPAAVVAAPTLVTLVLVGAVVTVVLLTRLPWALSLLVAASPFERYLDIFVTPVAVKGFGLLVFAGYALRLLVRVERRPSGHLALVSLGSFLLLALAATTVHPNGGAGLATLIRYLSFGALCAVMFVVLQADGALRSLLRTFVVATALSTTAALYELLAGLRARAGGPLDDPNDLAFFCAVAIPLAVALSAGQRLPVRLGWLATALLLGCGIAGTLSRGAMVAAGACFLWALIRGHVRSWMAVTGGAMLGLLLIGAAVFASDVVDRALHQKAYVASRNVDTRALRWEAALKMATGNPLVGIGPAGFALEYADYASLTAVDDATDVVAHQLYLELAAELGIPALVAFLVLVAASAISARRAELAGAAGRGPPGDQALAAGVQGAMLTALIAALFLTEQYYLPLWLLFAAGLALEVRARQAAPR